MSFAKHAARLAFLLSVSAATVVACSYSAEADRLGAPDSGADRGGEASGTEPTIDGPNACQPGDVSTFQAPAYRPAEGAHQGKCTQTQIDAFYRDCLASGSVECAAFGDGGTDADRAC